MFLVFRKFPGLLIFILGICLYNCDPVYKTETRTAHVTIPRGRFDPSPYPVEHTFRATLNEFWGTFIMVMGFGVWCTVDFFTLRDWLKGRRII